MRRRCDSVVIHNPARRSGGHSTPGGQGVEKTPGAPVNEVPELRRKYARQSWHAIFPDLDWKPGDP
jgi:hypothetical protein